ncbi:MAG: hypothetical protein JWM68_68 [Verrucomicrobiales bacterium]|nr:hypothetical protein [Verrucomicrobiales bacterium]
MVVAFLFSVVIASPAASRPPNVVLILADDLGWSDLGCYGGDLVETPNIDRLASEGVRFTDCYSASPVCSPTRASILTGKHPARLHMTTWFEATLQSAGNQKLVPPVAIGNLPLEEKTIAAVLHDAGYVTALVGKWHLGDASHYPEGFGFDANIGGTHWGAPETYFFPYRGSNTWGDGFRYVPHLEFGNTNEYLSDRLTDEAMRVIDDAKAKPFFLYLAHHAPHTPVEAKPEYVERYAEKLKANPSLHHRNAKYAAMIQSLDDSVGRVLAKLKACGAEENTLVIFTSDNGGYIGRWDKQQVTDNYPLRSGKGSLYEGGIRVPLIVRCPGVTHAGKVCSAPVISTDLYSTIAAAANLKNTSADGTSLLPFLKNEKGSQAREELFFNFPHYYQTTGPVSAVRAGDWKLLEYYEDKHAELYNLNLDPSEKKDLSTTMPEKTEELKLLLHDWLKNVGAQSPASNPDYKRKKMN